MPNVLIYTPTVGRGGVHLVVRKLLRGFADYAPKDWQFSVLGQRFDEIGLPVEYPADWPFMQVEPLSDGETLPAHPHQFQWLLNNAEPMVDHLKRVAGDYDLIYCPSPWWTMRVQDFTLPVPFVTTIADFAFDHIDMGLLVHHFRYVATLAAKQCTFVVFPSDFQRQHSELYYNFKRTRTISHSADFVADGFTPTPEEALRVREKYGLPNRYVLAFHCMYHKDPRTVLMGQLHARRSSPLVPPLVLAGIGTEHLLDNTRVDSHVEEIRALLSEIHANPGDDLFVLGRIPDEDVAGLFVGAAVSVSASTSEGDLAGGTFNAFMARTPHIWSDLPVYRDRVSEEYGWSFPLRDAEALGQRIVDVCENPDEAAKRALAAFGFTMRRTIEDVVRDYLMVFTEVLHDC